jgi:hypothetical protein
MSRTGANTNTIITTSQYRRRKARARAAEEAAWAARQGPVTTYVRPTEETTPAPPTPSPPP